MPNFEINHSRSLFLFHSLFLPRGGIGIFLSFFSCLGYHLVERGDEPSVLGEEKIEKSAFHTKNNLLGCKNVTLRG